MPRKGEQENWKERRARYKEWLARRPLLHQGWPREQDGIRQHVVRVMKAEGMLAKTTGWRDVRLAPILDELHGVNRDG